MDPDALRDTLQSHADGHTASARLRDIHPLRGVRGVPDGQLARVAAASWRQHRTDIDRDRAPLDDLFSTGFEDGLLAIALAAAALPDDAEAAYELGLDWLDFTDDPMTADAIGSLLLGPGLIAAERDPSGLLRRAGQSKEPARRAIAAAMMAWLPEPLTGPAVAALRARLDVHAIRFVEHPHDDLLALWATGFVRDEGPSVRKAMRRALRVWGRASPSALVTWAEGVRGGLPKMYGDEVRAAARREERTR